MSCDPLCAEQGVQRTATQVHPVEDAFRDVVAADKGLPPFSPGSGDVSLEYTTSSTQLHELFARLGMHPSAVHAWSKYHIHPTKPMAWFFVAQAWILATILYMLTGAPFSRHNYSIPLIVAILPLLGHTVAAWRWGPGFAVGRLFFASLPVFMLGTTIPTISSYLGRSENMPFGNSAHFTVVMGCFWMGRIVSNKTGMLGELGGMQCCCAVV